MIFILYQIFFTAFAWPFYLRDFFCKAKKAPSYQKGKKPCLWLHAVSLGETKAAAPFLKLLEQKWPEFDIVISTTTQTGLEEAKRQFPFAKDCFSLPLDFYFSMSQLVKQIQPDFFLLCEGDFWYNLLRLVKKRGAKTALINGKLSERSLQRMKLFSFFSKKLLSMIDCFCLQSSLYKARFLELLPENMPRNIPRNIYICGNLKLDIQYPQFSEQEKLDFRKQLGIRAKSLVIASTHEGEEKPLLLAAKEVDAKIILAPRHPERAGAVKALLKELSLDYVAYSEIGTKTGFERVILIDQIGLLNQCFAVSDLAIVAGSFSEKIGGHNILEPAAYAVPVLFGPYMYKQKDFLELSQEFAFGKQVCIEDLGPELQKLFGDKVLCQKMGRAGLEMIQKNQGASQKTLQILYSPDFIQKC